MSKLTNVAVRMHKRLNGSYINNSFYCVEHVEGDYVISEYYEDEETKKPYSIDVNISKLINLDLFKERYKIFRYGKSDSETEKSCFENLKGHDFRARKSDITLLIFDCEEEIIYLVCGEVKKTLKTSNFADAREQLLSSFVDLNIFNSLISYNAFPIKRLFFIRSDEQKLVFNQKSSSSALSKSFSGNRIPYNILEREWETRMLHYNLDDSSILYRVNKKMDEFEKYNFLCDELHFISN